MIKRLFLISILSYLAGIVTYIILLRIIWDQPLTDESHVIFGGIIVFGLVAAPIYWWCIKLLKKYTKRYAFLLYPFVCALVALIPAFFVLTVPYSAIGATVFSPEGWLFYGFFTASGIVFGLGWKLLKIDRFMPLHQLAAQFRMG
ncbi:MAG: hypothetical protein BLM47_13805 [Candidatus Reconcilbacillus cellulovorans]|uniref:Uncharacterized protein n=1 Tax=Candidatus Reconcilbacillus cellulovorans TaxID=1906605 RepID=A0A2A6DWP2_9BACL|nr:MAG: hypothetical protein BLM47_13805 [Candidatus Reconcilbacillus cellulovorans]